VPSTLSFAAVTAPSANFAAVIAPSATVLAIIAYGTLAICSLVVISLSAPTVMPSHRVLLFANSETGMGWVLPSNTWNSPSSTHRAPPDRPGAAGEKAGRLEHCNYCATKAPPISSQGKNPGGETMKLEDYFDVLAPDDIRLKGHRIGIDDVLYYYLERRCISVTRSRCGGDAMEGSSVASVSLHIAAPQHDGA